jgi:hypothetical protein
MAEKEPVERPAITRCQHCPELIEQRGSLWVGKREGQYVCDPLHIHLKHQPMPRVPA